MADAPATVRFRSARRSIAAAYLGHAVGLLLGGLGVTFVVQLLPEDWHWIGPLLIGLIVATMLVEPIWSYAFRRYTVNADAVVEEVGWLDRRVKTLRWSRVQALDRTTDWQLRTFGLATLTIAQAGQEAAQVEIRGIDAATIELVLAHARTGGATAEPAGEPREASAAAEAAPATASGTRSDAGVLYRASVRDLAIMSVMFGAAVLAAPAVVFGAWEAAEQLGLQGWLSGAIGRLEPVSAAVIAAVAVIALGVVKTVLTYHGFTVRRTGDELRIRHGLVITHERAFRETSIQGVVVQRNLLEQCTGRARLWLLTLDSKDDLGKNLVLPSLPLAAVERIAREAFPSRVPIAGALLAARPPILTALLTTLLALAAVGGTYAGLALRLGWPPLLAGAGALVALAVLSSILRVLLARLDADPHQELLLLRRTYLTESLRSVDLAAVRRVSARRVPRWLAPRGQRLLPSAAIYAGKRITLRALRADPAAVERIRRVCVSHAPAVAAATLAQHRA
ncbi:PH domain-containing protein [Agrococcus terreus]|uniref:PH domain-containing protein n=1 Tax=Agrococcus terreus TaxID=574649 RepID=UPI00384C7320